MVKQLTVVAETGAYLMVSSPSKWMLIHQSSELGCKVSHLALAWVAKNTNTSTVILGATSPEQIVDNLKALDVIPKLTPEILAKIEAIVNNKPAPPVSILLFLPGYSAHTHPDFFHVAEFWQARIRPPRQTVE